jgi:hypothetical protein
VGNHIVGWQTLDHPTTNELVALARRYFSTHEGMAAPMKANWISKLSKFQHRRIKTVVRDLQLQDDLLATTQVAAACRCGAHRRRGQERHLWQQAQRLCTDSGARHLCVVGDAAASPSRR